MDKINILAHKFRNAIDSAISAGEFHKDSIFNDFPAGCCGEASELLAKFLFDNGISTHYVWGKYVYNSSEVGQCHAWLLTDKDILIDITGDQFKYNPVFLKYDKSIYVGIEDDFHELFEIANINNTNSWDINLKNLYNKIIKYI